MLRTRALALALTAVALAVVAASGAAAPSVASADDDTEYFTWSVAAGGGRSVYTVVYDQTANDTFLLQRDAITGVPRRRFGGGYIAAAIAASSTGLVYVGGSDGSIRVYGRRLGRMALIDTWPVSVPGQSGTPYPTGIAVTPSGYVVVALTIAGSDPLGPPAFAGAVALDGSGSTVATWPVPSETLPTNAFVLPASITSAPGGGLYVNGIPCQAGLCGSPVVDEGWVYGLGLSTTGTPSLTTTGRWADPALVEVTHVAATGPATILATGAVPTAAAGAPPLPPGLTSLGTSGGSAAEYSLSPGGGVTLASTIAATDDPTNVSVAGTGAYLVESAPPPQDDIVIERFLPKGSGWARRGSPWTASWDSSGPPPAGLTCAGRPATLVGTRGDDDLRGTPGADVIVALGGDDRVRGLGGADVICLGAGDDRALGGRGADLILGERGSDRLLGGAGPDRLLGGPGRDVAIGGSGADVCRAELRLGC